MPVVQAIRDAKTPLRKDFNVRRSGFKDRPATIFFLVIGLVAIILYFYDPTHTSTAGVFSSYMLLPSIPVLLYENYIKDKPQNDRNHHLLDLAARYRFMFMLAGVILSFLNFLVIYLLGPIIVTSSVDNIFTNTPNTVLQVNVTALSVLALVTLLNGVLTAAAFYRVRAESFESGKRYNYFSGPLQISSLASYAFMTSNICIWLIWAGERLNYFGFNSNLNSELAKVLDGNSFIGILIPVSFYFGIVYGSEIIPSMIQKSGYYIPDRKIGSRWVIEVAIGLAAIIYACSIGLFRDFSNINTDSIVIILYSIAVFIAIIKLNSFTTDTYICKTCHLQMASKECTNCDIPHETKLPGRLQHFSRIYHPTCPSCGALWDSLSRRCRYCDFTIVLTCEVCSQTLNPLWKRCNSCGTKRRTIPDLAMQTKGSSGFARTQAILKLLAAILFPALMLQIAVIISVWVQATLGIIPITAENTLFDDYARVAVLAVTIASILIMMRYGSREIDRPIMQVANKVAIAPGTVLMLFAFTDPIIATFQYISFGKALTSLIFLILSLVIAVVYWFNSYRSLIQFRPVITFESEAI